jgi:hypothetical protein
MNGKNNAPAMKMDAAGSSKILNLKAEVIPFV